MNRDGLEQILREAVDIANSPEPNTRPWPIVLLMTLGAWLATLPILVLIAILAWDGLRSGGALLPLGFAIFAGAFVLLFAFPEKKLLGQMALALLMAGLGAVLFHFIFKREPQAGAIVTFFMAASAGLALPHSWQRTILGATSAAVLFHFLRSQYIWLPERGIGLWSLVHLQAAMWLIGRAMARDPNPALRLAPFLDGWLAMTLLGLVYCAGPAFLTPGALYFGEAEPFQPGRMATYAVSLACACASAVIVVRAFPALRQGWCLGIALTLAVFTCFMPCLGAVLLLAACCAADSKYRMACAAALAAAWAIGSAYYDLAFPLYQKAILFASVGVTVIAFSWRPLRALAYAPVVRPNVAYTRAGRICLVLGGVASLAIANTSMVRNEIIIARSAPAYIELLPVDPRSLVQGDFMRLNFQLPPDSPPSYRDAALAVAQRGKNHVTRLVRWHEDDSALRQGEFLVGLERKNGRWMVASDAWFFREGEAQRFATARYGEFRISPSGKALLVGLRGPNLEPL